MNKTRYLLIASFSFYAVFNIFGETLTLSQQITLLADGGTKKAVLALASIAETTEIQQASVVKPLKEMFGSMDKFRAELAEFKKGQGSSSNCLTPQQVQQEISKAGLPTVSIQNKKDAAAELINHFDVTQTGGKLLKELGATPADINTVKQALTKATAKA